MTVLGEQPACPDPVPCSGAFDFDSFVARHGERLHRNLTRRTGDHHEAEEVLQEALLRAYQHREAFVDDDGAAAWTSVVAQRLAVDRHRVARRSLSVSEVPDGSRVDRDTADVVIASSEARVALDVLATLPRRQAAILWAREVEGLSYAQIAERLELSEPTVRTGLSRGRKALRAEFVRRGHAVPAAGLVPFAPALLLLRGSGELGRPARRLVETKLVAVAAAAVLAVGAVTAAVPWSSPTEPDAVVTPASTGGERPLPLPPAEPAAEPAAPPAAPPPAPVAVPAPPPPAPPPPAPDERNRPVVPLPEACADAGAVGGCLNDELPEEGDELSLDLPLPDNPAELEEPGLNTDHIASCSELPDLPLTSCTTDPDAGDP